MATNVFEVRRPRSRIEPGVGMRIYWAVVTVLSLALLGMTVHVATPRDAGDLIQVDSRR